MNTECEYIYSNKFAKLWRVWEELFSHSILSLTHRHTDTHKQTHRHEAGASFYPDANARWSRCTGTGRGEDDLLFRSISCCSGKKWEHPQWQMPEGWMTATFQGSSRTTTGWGSFVAGQMDGSVMAQLLYWPWLSCFRQPELQRERSVPGSKQLRTFISLSAGLVSLTRLHEPQRCHQPPHSHGQGVARQQILLLSISVPKNTCAVTCRVRTESREVQGLPHSLFPQLASH